MEEHDAVMGGVQLKPLNAETKQVEKRVQEQRNQTSNTEYVRYFTCRLGVLGSVSVKIGHSIITIEEVFA